MHIFYAFLVCSGAGSEMKHICGLNTLFRRITYKNTVLLHHSRTLLYICTVRCLTCTMVHNVCSSPCCAVLQCVFSIAFILRSESNLAQLLAIYVTQEFIRFTGLYVTNMISPVKYHILKHLRQEQFSTMAHGCKGK